jgi:hypothetical protein
MESGENLGVVLNVLRMAFGKYPFRQIPGVTFKGTWKFGRNDQTQRYESSSARGGFYCEVEYPSKVQLELAIDCFIGKKELGLNGFEKEIREGLEKFLSGYGVMPKEMDERMTDLFYKRIEVGYQILDENGEDVDVEHPLMTFGSLIGDLGMVEVKGLHVGDDRIKAEVVLSWRVLATGWKPYGQAKWAGVVNRVAGSFLASRLEIVSRSVDERNTVVLRSRTKLRARSGGALADSIEMAGYYAKKMGKGFYVYFGNSYGHEVWRVGDEREALSPVNNTSGGDMFFVAPDLEISRIKIRRPAYQRGEMEARLVQGSGRKYFEYAPPKFVNNPETQWDSWFTEGYYEVSSFEFVPISEIDYEELKPRKIPPLVERMQAGAPVDPVRLTQVGNRYRVIDGNHRTLASVSLGYTHVPAVVYRTVKKKPDFPMPDIQKMELVLKEFEFVIDELRYGNPNRSRIYFEYGDAELTGYVIRVDVEDIAGAEEYKIEVENVGETGRKILLKGPDGLVLNRRVTSDRKDLLRVIAEINGKLALAL